MYGKIRKKGLAIFLTVALLLSCMPTMTIPVYAVEPTTIKTVDFETDGSGYTVTGGQTTSVDDWWARTDGTTISPDSPFTGKQGTYFFYGEDTDNERTTDSPVYVTLDTVNVSSYTNLEVKILVAGNNTVNAKKEKTEYLKIQYAIDGGAFIDRTQFVAPSVYATYYAEDTDCNGITDGASLSPAFTEFTYSIPVSGTNLQIRIAANINSGKEEVGFDNIRIIGTAAASPAKAITAFDFNGLTPAVIGSVDEGTKTIALTVPYGTDVTALVPSITQTGASISPNTGVAQNFTSPVTYTVTAADSSTQAYTVTVSVAANPAKAITAFDFTGLTPAVTGTVNEGAKTIALTVPYGTDVTALVPSITHTGASLSPNIGVAQNFTSPVTYTVTAADSSTQVYTVTVTAAANPAKAITAFDFNGLTPAVIGSVDEGTKTIALTVPYGTDVTALVPSITQTGASLSPNTGVAQNFTSPVTYTVTAADSSTQAYTVTVTAAANPAKAITAFDFNGLTPAVTGSVDEGTKTIALTVPYGTDVTALVPTITQTGASLSPNTGVAQNFTSPVTYTVTAADSSTQAYTVTVSVAANPAKAITAFDFNGLTPAVIGSVDEGAKTIALTVPYGTDVTALVPTITQTGASMSPNTGVAQNFTSPVTYTVTAADSSTQVYTVTVSVAANPAKAITAFDFNDLTPAVIGSVDEGTKTIALTVPYGTDVTALVPTITQTGASLSPNTGVAQNFTSPVTYTVTAADSSTQAYIVTVSIAANPAKAITAFDFNGLTPAVIGSVDEGTKTIALTVPYGTDVTALVPSITQTGASLSPNTGVAQNFTSPVTYTVTAADSSTQVYTVTVTAAANPAKAITAFDFNGLTPAVIGSVDESAKTIALTVPYGTDVTALVPSITQTGASISPNTGVAQNFISPVTYTVTAADSSTQVYTVTVTAAANPAKAITAFDFNDLTPAVTGTVNEGAKTIALTVPYGTDVTALVPTITQTGASLSPNTGVAQNFTSPVTYTVTAADSSTQVYTVTVTAAANPAKAITAFDFNGLTPAVIGSVDEGAKTIAVTVPYGTDVTALVPSITQTGASLSPNTGVAQNFTSPVTYTVTAADSSTQVYTVTVTAAANPANPAKSITAFDFNGLTPAVIGNVDEGTKTIALTVPYGTDVTALVPSITQTGASLSPNTGVAQNFTSPVTYTVTAADSSTQAYIVTVSVAANPANPAKAITAFDFNGLTPAVIGSVDEGTKTIALTVPYGTDVTALVPSITQTGASLSPNTGVAQNFTSPVTYTVTAADSSTQVYTVTVTAATNPVKAITSFSFNGLTPAVIGIVDEGAKTIALTVPYGTDVTALVPTITHTGINISPNSGVMQNYTTPAAYTVTFADSTTQDYLATVKVGASSNSNLSSLNISRGTLSPVFTSETTSYVASVSNAYNSITVTPTVADLNATVKVNGLAVASGSATGEINLSVGNTIITTVVTAQDGTTISNYTITVTRATSSDDSSDDRSDDSSSTTTTQPSQNISQNTVVIVNGKEQNAGKETQKTEDGKSTVTVEMDNKAIKSKIDDAIKTNAIGIGNVIQVSVADIKSEVAIVELTGDIVKKLEENTFDVSVRRDNIEYVIPAEEFTISKVANNLGVLENDLNNVKIEVKITKLDETIVAKYNDIAKANNAELVFPPVSFEVVAKTTKSDGTTGKTEINKFSKFVKRVMEIPEGVDPSKVTTGIVFNVDGTYSHVPTEIFQKDGKWYANLNSLTNSSYSIVWNPITVKSVEKHWAKDVVNDLASRLIIFNAETFDPNKAITRADFAEYMVRALGLYREGTKYENKFLDISTSGERTMAILIASEYGLVTGYPDGTFKPNALITREEAMVMYQSAMKITKLVETDKERYQSYTDYEQVGSWATPHVQAVLSAHIFNGTTATTLSPKSNLTYAEAAQAIKNLLAASNLINK